jgi:hypothetical protein
VHVPAESRGRTRGYPAKQLPSLFSLTVHSAGVNTYCLNHSFRSRPHPIEQSFIVSGPSFERTQCRRPRRLGAREEPESLSGVNVWVVVRSAPFRTR